MNFTEMTKKSSKLYANFFGMAGCGKTYSALLFATTLASNNNKVLVIDTESRASIYANDFKGVRIYKPESATIQLIINAIKEAKKQNFEAVVIDSLTPLWDGDDGLMTKAMLASNKSHGANWQLPKQIINTFTQFLKNSGLHIIVTSLAKEEVKFQKGSTGKDERVLTGNILPIFERAKFEPYLDLQLLLNKNGVIKKIEKGMHSDIIKEIQNEKQASKKLATFIKNWINEGEVEDNEQKFLNTEKRLSDELKKEELESKKDEIFEVIKNKTSIETQQWYNNIATSEEKDVYNKHARHFIDLKKIYKDTLEAERFIDESDDELPEINTQLTAETKQDGGTLF